MFNTFMREEPLFESFFVDEASCGKRACAQDGACETWEEDQEQAPNPHWQGLRVVDRDDLFPRGFSPLELNAVYARLVDDAHDEGLALEAPTLDELEYYNPGREEIDDAFVLEAITVDKFSRTEKRMKAVVRVLNRHLSGSEISALEPVIGRPKKTGSFAYVIVQLPFSDGQTVNVVFHAPEGDKKKIMPGDTIIAFRWLLNKRDITHVVAPEEGEEVSLETIAKRVTQLVKKNSARFERQQKTAQAERKALEEARQAVKDAETRQAELMDNVAGVTNEAEDLEVRLSNTLAQVEKQKRINAELEAKIAGLRQAGQGNGAGAGVDAVGTASDDQGLPKNDEARELPVVASVKSGVISGHNNNELKKSAVAWAERNLKQPAKTVIGKVIVNGKTIDNSLEHGLYQAKLDTLPAIVPTLENGAYLGIMPDKDGKSIDNHYFAAKVRIDNEEKVLFCRVRQAAGDTSRFYLHQVYTEDQIKKAGITLGVRDTLPPFPGTSAFYKNLIAKYLEVKGGGVETLTPEIDEARELPVVASVKSGVIKKTDTMTAVQAAQAWIKQNLKGTIETRIGEVEIDAGAVADSFSHSIYQNKLDAIQAIKPVLQQGTYLGELPDKDGKAISNHYFAAKVHIGENEKIVFVRTRKAAGTPNRFYVHEVFTEDEIEKAGSIPGVTDADRPFQNASDFYRNLIAKYLEVKGGGVETPTPENDEARELPVVASVKSGVIKKTDTMTAIQAAQAWIKGHLPSVVQTKVGDVYIDEKGIKDSLSHTLYQSKLDAIQAIVPVLKNGAYLGCLPDKDGKNINNYYFAAKVMLGDTERIIFVRTMKGGSNPNRFYVHEVFTDEETEKAGLRSAATGADQPFQNASSFYKNLIAKYLEVKGGGADAPDPKNNDLELQESNLKNMIHCAGGGSMSREEIFKHYSNTLEQIAAVPKVFLKYFSTPPSDARVYCGLAYFVDHCKNHHPEIDLSEYKNIQNVLSTPDEIIKDAGGNKNRDVLIFVKKINGTRGLVVELSQTEEGKTVLYKTWMPTREKPYPGLPRVWPSPSPVGVPGIQSGSKNEPPAGSRISALDGTENISNQPAFVNDLNDIIAGKYDNNYDAITPLMDKAVEEAEAANQFEAYEDLFNEALDHQIAIRKKMREAL